MKMLDAPRLLLTTCCLIGITFAKHPYNLLQDLERGRRVARTDGTGLLIRRADYDALPKHRFLTERTKDFAVNGSAFPEVDFDLGESYAGLVPVSKAPDETKKLFFWFWPSVVEDAPKEVVIWLNGGPGCSSLLGFLSENGVFLWQDGTHKPVPNSFDWRNLTNVLWIEQPVGTGYTQGNVTITNETGLAEQFVEAYEQIVSLFGLQGYDLYLSGESYAGFFVPYIANELLDRDSPTMPLKGIHINDPTIGGTLMSMAITVQPFFEYWSNLFSLNDTTMSILQDTHEECGYADFLAKYFTFPPPQQIFQPLATRGPLNSNENYTDPCDTLSIAFQAAAELNPCVSVYRITDRCPLLQSYLDPYDEEESKRTYFNRTDVKQALHVPVQTSWEYCSTDDVFVVPTNKSEDSDHSVPPGENGVLQRVIEKTGNVIIGSGNLDGLINTNGTLLAIQNMTWNGYQGLTDFPGKEFYAPYHPMYNIRSLGGAGIVGKWGMERGLTFYQIALAGHMVPGDAPGASYRVLEVLLGRVENLGSIEPFTTLKGNWTKEDVLGG